MTPRSTAVVEVAEPKARCLCCKGQPLRATYLGGPNYDRVYAIEAAGQGNVYVGGRAGPGFPVTSGVVQTTFGGDANVNVPYGPQDGFIAKFNSSGQLLWATYFGGNDRSFFRDIAVDSSGNVYGVMAEVSASNPHITAGAYQTSLAGGDDGLVVKISPDGRNVLCATYLGGSGNDFSGPAIRVDGQGNVYVGGSTRSTNFPTTAGAYDRTFNGNSDMSVAKFSSTGALLFSTYFGGSQAESSETHSLGLNAANNVILAATTRSTDLPTTAGAYDRTYNGSGGSGTGANSNYHGGCLHRQALFRRLPAVGKGDFFASKLSADLSRSRPVEPQSWLSTRSVHPALFLPSAFLSNA